MKPILSQVEAEKNAPLTLDELREMGEEPVWIIMEQDGEPPFKRYGIVNAELECVLGIEFMMCFENYGEWPAYRRKPKED